LAQSLPLSGVVVVLTPQDVATQIASKALAMFQQLKVPILGILENMSRFVCPHCGTAASVFKQGGGRRASEQLGVPLLGEIPLDPLVCRASDRGEPIVTVHGESPMAEAFRRAAEAVVAQVDAVAGAGPVIRMGP
jgi:ATP-binding protein involved in chromosome partitioning